MSSSALQFLVVDHDEASRKTIHTALERTGLSYGAKDAAVLTILDSMLEDHSFDCVILNMSIMGKDTLETIAKLHAQHPHLCIVLVCDDEHESTAARALRCGASDFILAREMSKEPDHFKRVIQNGMERCALEHKFDQQREELLYFSRVLAHDLKAPTRQIRSFLDLIDQGWKKGKNPDELREYFDLVCSVTERMYELIEALSAYTKVDHTIEFEPVALEEVLNDSLAILDHLIKEKGATIEVHSLPTVRGHAPVLMQLFQNLIANALKYNQSDAPKIVIDSKPDPNDLGMHIISVTDNGIGIDPKSLQEIFEPFKRLHGEHDYDGSGLGLSICRKIVVRHQGKIWCESEPGNGCSFLFTLPISY